MKKQNIGFALLNKENKMNATKIVVTVKNKKEDNSLNQVYISRIFSTNRAIKDMLKFAEIYGNETPEISDLIISEYTGEST